ncbi:MAG: SUMF1/EgtB/PvdO family nonheme iron enzyme [Chloroflexota bacterium]
MIRFFVSYSRADDQFLRQFIDMLERTYNRDHFWYDREIPGGSDWWRVLEEEIEKCDIFIALFSNDALESEYCQKELRYAHTLGKPILPVVVRPKTKYPENLFEDMRESMEKIHFINLSQGFSDVMAVMPLIRAINYQVDKLPTAGENENDSTPEIKGLSIDQSIDKFYRYRAEKKWHLTRQLLDNIKNSDDEIPSFFKVDEYLASIDEEEKREHAYTVIKVIANHEDAGLVRSAISDFQAEFPNYDPENVFPAFATKQVVDLIGDPIEWCDVEGRDVEVEDASGYFHMQGSTGGVFSVASFKIAKYAVTNAQYQRFVDADDGYRNPKWWDFSPYADNWRDANKQPKASAEHGANLPRTNVSWFEAIAFCRWLSEKTGKEICLPTEPQWQLAAQGNEPRAYPWGDNFDERYVCHNTKGVVSVTEYASGASPCGAYQMSGNVLEWCLTEWKTDENQLDGRRPRVVRGGSWYKSKEENLKTTYRLMNYPDFRANNRGFRLAMNLT